MNVTGTGYGYFNHTSGFNESINTPMRKNKIKEIIRENKNICQKLLGVPSTINFEKMDKHYDKLMTFQKQMSHFSGDKAFKRFFSGFGPDCMNHSGVSEIKDKPP